MDDVLPPSCVMRLRLMSGTHVLQHKVAVLDVAPSFGQRLPATLCTRGCLSSWGHAGRCALTFLCVAPASKGCLARGVMESEGTAKGCPVNQCAL